MVADEIGRFAAVTFGSPVQSRTGRQGVRMGRFDPYSRRELRRRRRAWFRTNRVIFGSLILGLVVMLGLAAMIVASRHSSAFAWWALGAFQAGGIGASLLAMERVFLARDAQAIWHVRGSFGEENTRSELGRAKRRRLVWDWVDSIDLREGDLDHLVVTRRGGLLVIDSKWRTDIGDLEDMARSARRAATRAQGVVRTVAGRAPRTGHRERCTALRVTPVVVLWGGAQRDLPEPTLVDGVAFVPGRQLVPWLRGLESEVVAKQVARDLIKRLEGFRARTWGAGSVAADGTRRRIEPISARYRAFLPFSPTRRRPEGQDPDPTGSPSTRPLPYIRT